MQNTTKSAGVLVLTGLLLSTGQIAGAQCHGGQPGGTQGRMRASRQLNRLSTGIGQSQLNSLSSSMPTQQAALLASVQQQIAMLGLQELQASRQRSVLQQQPSALPVAQPGQLFANGETGVKRGQRRNKFSAESDIAPLAPPLSAVDKGTEDEIAARRLRMAKDLAGDAELSQSRGERRSASRLRERAGERLLYIVENYSTTASAAEARTLMEAIIQQSSASPAVLR